MFACMSARPLLEPIPTRYPFGMPTKPANKAPLDPEKLLEILDRMARSLDRLGLNREMADQPHAYPGALEKISFELKDGSERIADAINNLADAIRSTKE